ncbi:MAG: L-lysine 6-transaminase [Bacteroidota bacterium]
MPDTLVVDKNPVQKETEVTGKKVTAAPVHITPQEVHSTLAKHMLADGLDMVVDLQKSHGCYIYDSRREREFLDFFSFFASSAVGMNHPGLNSPAFREKLGYAAVNKPTLSDIYTVEMAEFVETFSRIAMPSYFPYVFYIDGGALANENALKTAFDWKVRKNFIKGYTIERGHQVIHFRQAFHGRSGYTMSLTNTDPTKTNYFPKFKWPRILNPAIRFPLNERNLNEVINAEQIALGQIKEAIINNPDDIAAMIIEPIQSEGGDHHFRKEFFVELRRICDENEIMLIFDEVQTGVGLTGAMWAHEHFVKPDMMAFGKKTHICGFMCSTRVDEVKDNVFHKSSRLNSTFGGNLVDMVRFTKILQIIEEENLVENARVVGEYLLIRLQEIGEEFPLLIHNIRGRGLMCAMDFDSPESRREFRKKAYELGLIIMGCGERTIRFRPPLILSKEDVDRGMQIIRQVLSSLK